MLEGLLFLVRRTNQHEFGNVHKWRPTFSAISDLPTYLPCLTIFTKNTVCCIFDFYPITSNIWGLFWNPLPTLKLDVIYGHSLMYQTCAIITRGFYTFYPLFEVQKRFFKRLFLKILALCMVSIQERFLIKSGLWWHAYCMSLWIT